MWVISLRESLRARRATGWGALILTIALAMLIWAHSGGEAPAMPGGHGAEQDALTVCLGVLTGFAAVGLRTPAPASAGCFRAPSSAPRVLGRIAAGVNSGAPLPPPRAGPASLQVFLR